MKKILVLILCSVCLISCSIVLLAHLRDQDASMAKSVDGNDEDNTNLRRTLKTTSTQFDEVHDMPSRHLNEDWSSSECDTFLENLCDSCLLEFQTNALAGRCNNVKECKDTYLHPCLTQKKDTYREKCSKFHPEAKGNQWWKTFFQKEAKCNLPPQFGKFVAIGRRNRSRIPSSAPTSTRSPSAR